MEHQCIYAALAMGRKQGGKMSGMKELDSFLASWEEDPLNAKLAFEEYRDFLSAQPGIRLDFKSRPGVSYSLRAGNAAQKDRDLFVLVDVVDDEPANRWLSICFYADMTDDPDEVGDFVPAGLLGEDALCFNLDEDDPAVKNYIMERIRKAAARARE